MSLYTGAFRTLLGKALHVEANYPLLELRINDLGLRFLYKIKRNTSYIDTKHTGWQRGPKYEENEWSKKPTGVCVPKKT